jgi:ribosomal-protein-alanine N-acetyltransferase
VNPLLIRPANQNDLDAIAAMIAEEGLSKWTPADLSQELKRACSTVLVGEFHMHLIVGFVHVRAVPSAETDGYQLEICNIAVAREHKRAGFGRMLMENAIAELDRYLPGAVRLEVRASNHSARSFYGKLGFVETGVRKSYYHLPEDDAVIMTLVLRR